MTAASLKAWRERMNFTQKKAADEIGCSVRSITNWEGGVADVPRYIALACAAIAQGVPPIK